MPERQFGPYRLVRQIAVGGMAEIHLAKTKGLAGFEKYVALKMIHPNFAEDEQFIQMLVDEAKIAVQLTHGNIAQTFDLGRVGDTYYITMEYIDGADLYKLLRAGSEIDLELPIDVCAFVGKEVAGALDYAHRKKDAFGKSLGIVHRDVSPQNVLVSYAGEVKLVDFGIAKATSKAKQTAIGVIKGKYYYMSPEQAWGDPLDFRSDIFSAGIVLYEMLTGQMLYLEEDLHRLLEMARRAAIAPPSTLRKGIPPQLERIVMHALAKVPGERYQSAGDLATDLERFLHSYAPVFTAAKLSTLLREVVGEPVAIPDEGYEVEVRSGPQQTHPLPAEAVLKADEKAELRDENSVLFRLVELDGSDEDAAIVAAAQAFVPPAVKPAVPVATAKQPSQPVRAANKPPTGGSPVLRPVPKLTRAADPAPEPAIPAIPSPVKSKATGPIKRANPTPVRAPAVVKPRGLDEHTREMDSASLPPVEEPSGLLTFDSPPSPAQRSAWTDAAETESIDEELENIGERTVITKHGADDDGEHGTPHRIDATMVTAAPRRDPADDGGADVGDIDAAIDAALAADAAADVRSRHGRDVDDDLDDEPTLTPEDDGPTIQRDFRATPPDARSDARSKDKPRVTDKSKLQTSPLRTKTPAPAEPALSANIHSPAVSELRKPRPSRRTPPGGVPAQNNQNSSVLQAIVGSRASEPMPMPRSPTPPPQVSPPSQPPQAPPAPPATSPQHLALAATLPFNGSPPVPTSPPHPASSYAPYAGYSPQPSVPPYSNDPSRHRIGVPTPPPGIPVQVIPGVPPHLQPYAQTNAYGFQTPPGYPAMNPGMLYEQPRPMPPSLTGQLRLSEGDELPSGYKLSPGRNGIKVIVIALSIVAVAAGTTALFLRQRDASPTTGTIRFTSQPPGAEITYDGSRLTDKTPFELDGVPVGSRHEVTIELPRYEPETRTVDVPHTGNEIEVTFALKPVVGKIIINCPANTEIRIDGVLRHTGPGSITDVDLSAKRIEFRAPGFQPESKSLDWPANGVITIDALAHR